MIAVLKIVALCTAIIVSHIAAADDDDAPSTQKVQRVAGQTVIHLNDKAQQLSGLKTLTLKPASYHAEFTTYGNVLPIQPLMALRHRYLTALTDIHSSRAKFNQSTQTVNREQSLYQEGVSAKRNLQNQQAQWQIDKAQLEAMQFQTQSIREEAELAWGKTLTAWLLADNSDKLNALISGQQKLLQITLPSNQQLAEHTKTIAIDATGHRDQAQAADFISAAPQTDANTQGKRYFFLSHDQRINSGMNVTAWLPQQNSRSTGVIIPKSALLWSMEQALVYVKIDDDSFSRRLITHYTLSNDGYFISEGLKPDEELVITGGQMLLSEEMRGQIPEED